MRSFLRTLLILVLCALLVLSLFYISVWIFSRSERLQQWAKTEIEKRARITLDVTHLNLDLFPFHIGFSSLIYENSTRNLRLALSNCEGALNPLYLFNETILLNKARCEDITLLHQKAPRAAPINIKKWLDLLRHLEIPEGEVGQFSFSSGKEAPMSIQVNGIRIALEKTKFLGKKRFTITADNTLLTDQAGTPLLQLNLNGTVESPFSLFDSPYPKMEASFSLTHILYNSAFQTPLALQLSLSGNGALSGRIKSTALDQGAHLLGEMTWQFPLSLFNPKEKLASPDILLHVQQLAWGALLNRLLPIRSTLLDRLAEIYPTASLDLRHTLASNQDRAHLLDGQGLLALTLPTYDNTPASTVSLAYRTRGLDLEFDHGTIETVQGHTLSFKGGLRQDTGWDLSVTASEFPLSPWLYILTGQELAASVDLTGHVTGPLKTPEASATFIARNIDYIIFYAQALRGTFSLHNGRLGVEAHSEAPGISAEGLTFSLSVTDLFTAPNRRLSITAGTNALPWSFLFPQPWPNTTLSSRFSYHASLNPKLKTASSDAAGDARFTVTNLVLGDLKINDAQIGLSITGSTLTFTPSSLIINDMPYALGSASSLSLRRAETEQILEGTPLPNTTLSLRWPIRRKGTTASGTLTTQNFSLAPFLSALSWADFNPVLTGQGRLTIPFENPRTLTLVFKGDVLSLDIEDTTLSNSGPVDFVLQNGIASLSKMEMKGGANRFTLGLRKPVFTDEPLSISIDGMLSASLINTVYPTLSADSGEIKATLDIVPSTSSIAGTASVHDLSLSFSPDYPEVMLRAGKLIFHDQELTIDNLRGEWSDGTLSIAGRYNLKTPANSDLTIKASGIEWTIDAGFNALLDTNLHIGQGLLSGTIDLIEGVYNRPFQLINFILKPQAGPSRASSSTFTNLFGDMALDLAIQDRGGLSVENNVARLSVRADLDMGGTLTTPRLNGTLTVDEGQINFMGFTFDETQGDIVWNNADLSDPRIHIEGTRDVEDYRVHAIIEGSLANLKIDLESDPPLSDNDVFQVLLTGQAPGTPQNFMSTQFATSQLLGLVERPLSEFSGLDVFKLESGPSEYDRTDTSTRVYLGKQISDRLFINYSTNIDLEERFNAVEAEYLLFDNLLLKAERRDNQRYSFDLTIRFEAN